MIHTSTKVEIESSPDNFTNLKAIIFQAKTTQLTMEYSDRATIKQVQAMIEFLLVVVKEMEK